MPGRRIVPHVGAVLVLLLSACSTASALPSETVSPGPPAGATTSPGSASGTGPGEQAGSSGLYHSSVRRIGPDLRARMRFSHGPGCPLRWSDLRYLQMTYVGFDGKTHTGEMVVHASHARAVTEVFRQVYDARWPIRGMRLVDDYGDDDRSMAANNTSGYNCRRVAGTDSWSAHAYGAAIDVNPVQNPDVTGSSIGPPAGRRFALIDRSAGAHVPAGTIRAGDVVVSAFAGIGWEWGGTWSKSKDYQHFSAGG
jgi:poly-gamma-glutamate synthesis protein (capsule biosynthesis protein)